MGSCLGSSSGSEPEERTRSKSEYKITTAEGKYKTSAWSTEFVAKSWVTDTEQIWNRPLSALSCHMDLPRLGHKMQVFAGDQPVKPSNESATKMGVVLDILVTLAEHANESEELQTAIRDRYYNYVMEDGSGDLSQQLKRFLEEVVPEDSKFCNILSLCHQKIVFPAYYSIKENIHDSLPFKDSRGSWTINVYLTEDTCTVVHSKVQMGKDAVDDAEPEYSFRWELVARISGQKFDKLDEVFVRIAEVTIRQDVSNERRQEIRGVFKKFYQFDEE